MITNVRDALTLPTLYQVSSKKPPAVSVLVTVYNREQYLAACLDSILESGFQDFEVIVVDDQSTDGSVRIAEQYAAMDPRVSFHRNDKNLGDYPNRARAINLSCAPLIKFVDADDLIYPHSLEFMVHAMNRFPDAALGLSHSAPELDQPYPLQLLPNEAYRRQFLGRGCLGCGPSGAIFRREAYEAVGGFQDWGVLSDMDLWQRLAARWPLVLLPPALVWWRRHEGQEFTRGDAERVYLERGFALRMEALHAQGLPMANEEREQALRRLQQHHARRLLGLATKGRKPKVAWALFRRSGLGLVDLAKGLAKYR